MSKIIGLCVLAGFSFPVQAATQPTETFIRGSGPTIYWLGGNGKRYVFPNYATYRSWSMSPQTGEVYLPQVAVVPDAELSTYPLAGIVRERPGVRMVKIQTDPKVYAVSAGGILHWIPTEAVATLLYGQGWNKKIDDVPVGFFAGYVVGDPVACESFNGASCSAEEANLKENYTYSPQREFSLVTTPDDDERQRENYSESGVQ